MVDATKMLTPTTAAMRQLALNNLIISLGQVFHNITCGLRFYVVSSRPYYIYNNNENQNCSVNNSTHSHTFTLAWRKEKEEKNVEEQLFALLGRSVS